MDDTACRKCSALVTPVGQSGGVFCATRGCPFVRLSSVDVTNVCAENAFCLNFSGERVAVRAQEPGATPPPAVELKKKKPKPARPSGPDLFGALP